MLVENEPEQSRPDWPSELMFVIVTVTPWILVIWMLWHGVA